MSIDISDFVNRGQIENSKWRSTSTIRQWPMRTCLDMKCSPGSTIVYKQNTPKSRNSVLEPPTANSWTCSSRAACRSSASNSKQSWSMSTFKTSNYFNRPSKKWLWIRYDWNKAAYFWPRALLKGPKRSFVVVGLVGVETWVNKT